MTTLNLADDIRLGGTQVDKVMLGSTEVWSAGVDEAWSYYREVTVSNTGGSAKTDYTAEVNLTSANFSFANADTDGHDIQFRAADGVTVLDHWREAYDSTAQTATLWVRVPSIGAGGFETVRIYYGNAAADDGSDVEATFLFGEDFRLPEAVTNIGAGSFADGNAPLYGNREIHGDIAIHGGTGWRQNNVREQSNIVWTGTEFVILVTGTDTGGDCDSGLYYATEIDGTWTEYASNPVLPLAEDCYITVTDAGNLYRDGSNRAYVFFERKQSGATNSQLDIGVARTTDFRTYEVWNGSAWSSTLTSHAAVLIRTAAAWDADFTGSPTVVHDGSQFVCLYEGAVGTTYATGVARSADGISWTKAASNPVSTLDVVDDVAFLNGAWWMTGHGTAGQQYRYVSATDGPGAWSSTSFVQNPSSGSFDVAGNSMNFAFGFTGAECWCTFQDGIGTQGIGLYNFLGGGSKWAGQRLGQSTDGVIAGELGKYPVGVVGTALQLQHRGSETRQVMMGVYTATDISKANGFAVRMRKRTQNGPDADDQYSITCAIGTGAPGRDTTTGYMYLENGYTFANLDPGSTAGIVIREFAAALTTNHVASNTLTQAEHQAYNIHECRYGPTGLLDYRVAGTSRGSVTDTTHLAGNKKLLFAQGGISARRAGKSQWEWIVARPFDGVDTTATVGAETTL